MTLQRLAELADVSVSTVSKAFSDSGDISSGTKEKILSLAKQHGCFEKYYKGKFGKKIVAVICPEIRSAYYTDFAASLNDKIEKRNGMMILSVSGFDRKKEEDLIRYYGSFGHADGIIVVSGTSRLKEEPTVPVVFVGGKCKTTKADCIDIDLSVGIDRAVKYLKQNGHKNIGFIGEPLVKSKYQHFCEAMHRNALTVNKEFIFNSDKRFEAAGYEALEHLMKLSVKPTAIIAAYDYMAIGALRYAQESGIKIPNDISVIGMDNIPVAAYLGAPLTTIVSHSGELCDTAVDLIFKKIENQFYFARQDITLKSQLVIRDSVADISR